MILKKIEVTNFRLLKKFELTYKDELSLIIGKNNCGKTSTLIILDKMINGENIIWEDVNLQQQKVIYESINNFDSNDENGVDLLEGAKLRLFIEYSDSDSYVNIQKFMMDLIPENNIILLEFSTVINRNRIVELKKIINEKKIKDFEGFSKYMSKNFKRYFVLRRYSRGFDVKTGTVTKDLSREIDLKDISNVIKVSGIRADRAVSNDERNHVLSKLTGEYYKSLKSGEKRSEKIISQLEDTIEKVDKLLTEVYNGSEKGDTSTLGIFSEIIRTIGNYGGVEDGVDITIDSSISEKDLLQNNTRLTYKYNGESSLPESYNGLGYLNLIGILFEVETKIQKLFESPADINILFIEEPEAHTHPQLQYIFIRNIKKHLNEYRRKFIEAYNKNLQLIITSHSSHIVAECDFDDVIYMKKEDNTVTAKSFNSLKDEYSVDAAQRFKFVKQYLTLERSELFFADKAICIEGDTERILMPAMMSKIDKEVDSGDEKNTRLPLLSQNISIIVTGAYSHIFMPLFQFLGTKVLIITDIDAVKKESKMINEPGNGRSRASWVKCSPEEATSTSNSSLKMFYKADLPNNAELFFEWLTSRKSEEKIKGNIRIAYQVPESPEGYQARSFEDAFIFLNQKFIISNKEKFVKNGALKGFQDGTLKKDVYKFSTDYIVKKSTFATSILYFAGVDGTEWSVPYYIKEGLLWLRQI